MPSFLQTSFLAGLAALAVPILIHLFFRLKTKRVELGTIRFLRLVLEENARRRKVMRWLLLALRMAFVALLVGLFARPFLTAAATGSDKELLVILIDQSATMQLKGENGRLIDQAIAEAKKLIETAGTQTRFEVAFFDHDVHPLTDSKAGDGVKSDAVLAKLQAPVATFGATNFGAVFAWARDICVKAPAGVKQLHLFTDLQRSGLDWTEVEPLPAEVKPHLHDLGRPVVNNVAVTEVRTPRLWVRPGESPTIRASVLHGGTFALEDVAIVLEIGRVEAQGLGIRGQEVEKNSRRTEFAKLAERITKRERVKLEPGATVTLDFELPALGEGLWQGRVTVEFDDDLPFDNQRFFAISATPAYRVLVVSGESDGSAITSETYFLDAALRLADLGDSYSASPFAPTLATYVDGASLPKLSDFDVVVLANVADVSKPDADQLASFVRSGGGLLVFTGDRVSAKSCSTLTDAGLTVGEIGDTKVTNDLPWRLTQWDDKHPIFEPLSDPQHGDLRRLIFAAYTKLTPSADTNVLAQFSTGDPAVLERRVGEGTMLWVTTSCGRDWSDWCRSRLFLPTVHQLLGYEVGLTSGGRVRSRLVDAEPKTAVGGQRPKVRAAEPRDSDALTSAAIPGVDQFERFAEIINTSPRESDTDRCTRQEFEDRFAVKFVEEAGTTDSQAAVLGNVELQQDELWHWVGCVLLGVMLLEGFVGNRTTA
ncbi:MAG: BatA domain-containing protein [Planctomycetaceae bacterium]|nr:BatA domain-containing protein [Planctomycetaceae bacterium]